MKANKLRQFIKAFTKIPHIIQGLFRYLFYRKSNNKITTEINDITKRYNMRLNICEQCEYVDMEGDKCLIPNTKPCCGICGCSLHIKALSEDHCPKGKW